MVLSLLPLVGRTDVDQHCEMALPWIHEAGNPYFDWCFGGAEQARQVLTQWIRRPSSEVWIGRATLLLCDDQPVGGFLALDGIELVRARKADAVATIRFPNAGDDKGPLARLRALGRFFISPEADEYYLSKVGVVGALRGQGAGRFLAESFLRAGETAGFRRFRLDVCEANLPAIRLYESLGFRIMHYAQSDAAPFAYLAMALGRGSA